MKDILKIRFEKNMNRHPSITWDLIEEKLNDEVMKVLSKMENSGGEVDVIELFDGKLAFADCCLETSKDRRSLCFDKEAWDKRKNNKPIGNVMDMVKEIGSKLMNEEEYLVLQTFGDFDCKSQVWILTSEEFRKTGDALFANKRHGRVFIYYNGAESYYSDRGFRTIYYLN